MGGAVLNAGRDYFFLGRFFLATFFMTLGSGLLDVGHFDLGYGVVGPLTWLLRFWLLILADLHNCWKELVRPHEASLAVGAALDSLDGEPLLSPASLRTSQHLFATAKKSPVMGPETRNQKPSRLSTYLVGKPVI